MHVCKIENGIFLFLVLLCVGDISNALAIRTRMFDGVAMERNIGIRFTPSIFY